MKEKDSRDRILTIPNVLTMLRMSLAVPFFLFIGTNGITSPVLCASFALGLAATDAVDGYVARRFHMQSNFGEVLDPIADKVFNWGLCLSLISCGAMPLWPLLIAVRDISVAGVTFYQYKKNHIRMKPTFPAKLKMALQSMGVISTMLFGFGTESILSMIAPFAMAGAISTSVFEVAAIKMKYFKEENKKISTTMVEKSLEQEQPKEFEQKKENEYQKQVEKERVIEPTQKAKVKQKSLFKKYD